VYQEEVLLSSLNIDSTEGDFVAGCSQHGDVDSVADFVSYMFLPSLGMK
jgi:hypothetical protein